MEWNELEAKSSVVKFSRQIKPREFVLGRIFSRGKWAWLVEDNTLQIVALKSGQIISSYTFLRSIYNCKVILCVEEVIPNRNSHDVLLAVCLDYIPNNAETDVTRSTIAIYSVEHGSVLSSIRLELNVTSMRFLPLKNCRRSFFQHFDGCIAVGTQEGAIFMIDLSLNYFLELYGKRQHLATEITQGVCRIVYFQLTMMEIQQTYQNMLRARSLRHFEHFGIELEAMDLPCKVEQFLPIDVISGLAVGFEDGRLLIYDLWDMRIYYASEGHEQSPLIKMDFLEPPDDPRPCFYIMTLHENGEKVVSCLFAFMYEKRVTDDCDIFFENFRYGAMKMDMILESDTSKAITCQAITKPAKSVDDDATCLFAISWNSVRKEQIKLLVFDINQWYKEEMPRALSGNQAKSCIANFKLNTYKDGLDTFLNPITITQFNSMQRCEEHFYPNSLSFDWVLLEINCCRVFNWPGIQNTILNVLRSSTSSLFLEPDVMFEKIRRARLMPQFTEVHINALFSQNAKYEILLSVALEHNCMGLLRDCARSWADGSFTGNNSIIPTSGTELSLQTLENWIWKRAFDINMRCNELCEELLSTSGHPLDQREKKELGFITRQLRSLAELYDEVMHQYSKHQGEKVKNQSLNLTADYQELLIWVINIGLLPERSRGNRIDDMPTTSTCVTSISSLYPYKQLRDYYVQRRLAFAERDECCISKKSGSCRLIFIDSFIEHECMRHAKNAGVRNSDNLREHWLENNGNGLYPPTNIESMLRIMLLPNVDYESKCSILLYFFLDLHVALTDGDRHDGEDFRDIVQNFLKFPNVFKLSPSLIKTLQAFWHLDHGNIVAAVDEFLSPFNNNRKFEQWLIQLLMESLLLQNAAHLALRILDAYSSLISPSLKLSTLLANNLIAEAFHFVRSKSDIELMRRFFTNCLRMGKLGVIRDLALHECEGKLVENLLKRIKLPGAENLHFVYLLQKSKYIEAVSYMDELSKGKIMRYGSEADNAIDTPNLVISAFNTTMAPVTQSLTDVYFRIRNKIKQKEMQNRSPVPLSCQLMKQNANNLLGGIYHSSALSAHFATFYYGEELRYGQRKNKNARLSEFSPLSANNAPFLRKPQTETYGAAINMLNQHTLSYPQEFQPINKRRISELESEDVADTSKGENSQQQKPEQPNKKRRLLTEDFITGFKHIKEKNIVLNDTGLNLTSQVNESFLTKPLITKEANHKRNEDEKSKPTIGLASVKSVVINELHSILKSNTPEPAEVRTKRGQTPTIEQKTLRFVIPSTQEKPKNETDGSDVRKEAEEIYVPQVKHRVVTRSISEESCEENVDVPQYYSALSAQDPVHLSTSCESEKPKKEIDGSDVGKEPGEIAVPKLKRRVVTRSISDESCEENVDMSKYYSDLSTQNLPHLSTSAESVSIKDSRISITTKLLKAEESSVSLYRSVRGKSLSPNTSGPKPRKPLLRMSAEPEKRLALENKDTVTYSKETIRGSSLVESINKERNNEVPITLKPNVPALFKITSVTTLSSAEFAPQVCSSKVGDTQTKSSLEQVKMSERSTIVMTNDSMCDTDLQPSIQPVSEPIFIQPRAPLASIEENQNDSIEKVGNSCLDTTLGMSSCEISDFDTTAVGTVPEVKSSYGLQLLELTEANLIVNSAIETREETCDEIGYQEANEPEEIIELLSSTDENDIDVRESESPVECETDEESLISNTESENLSDETGNTDTNQETFIRNETDPIIEIDIVEELSNNDSVIELHEEDSDTSNLESNKQSGLLSETDHVESSKPEFETEKNETKLNYLDEAVKESQKEEKEEFEPTVSASEKELNLLEKSPFKYPLCKSNSQSSEASIMQIGNLNENVNKAPEKQKEIFEPIPNRKEGDKLEKLSQKTINLQPKNSEYVERIEGKLVKSLKKAHKTTVQETAYNIEHISKMQNESVLQSTKNLESTKNPEKEMYSETAILKEQSSRNLETSNRNETDPMIKIDIPEELSTSDSVIELQEGNSETSHLVSNKQSSLLSEIDNVGNSKPEFGTEKNETKLNYLDEASKESQKAEKEECAPTVSAAKKEQKLLEKSPFKYPECKSNCQSSEASIMEIGNLNENVKKPPEKVKELFEPIPNRKEGEKLEKPSQKTINLQPKNSEYVERIEGKLVKSLKKAHKTTVEETAYNIEKISKMQNESVLQSTKNLEKEMYSDSVLLEQQSSPNREDGIKGSSEKREKTLTVSPNVYLKRAKETENEKNTIKDLDTSEDFETPNTSFNFIQEIEKCSPNIDLNIAVESFNTNRPEELQTVESSTQFNKKSRRRGQSLPPQPLLVNEQHIETDSQTPRRRSKRGISVPPQTVDSVELTPTGRQKGTSRNVLLSGKSKTINDEGESQKSLSSSPSGHGSQQMRLWGSGDTPQLDSPALRTRSRMRTISENSDATAASLNSPSAGAKKTRRTSLTSTLSEHLQLPLTPKRSRRSSISGQSDTEGTPRTRRLIMKEVEDEAQNTEVPNIGIGMDIYSSTRRLTRTQRALLEKSEQLANVRDGTHDDQASVSSRISQSSTQSKRRTARSASVKSNDNGDDDRESVTSSVASETRRSSRRLRAQQKHSPNVNLSSIPEDDTVGGAEPPPKRNKSVKK